jgi:hypothetical protein
MGFPNIDKILVAIFKAKFDALKAAPEFTINDLFEDLSAGERAEITAYIQKKQFHTDIRDRKDSAVFLMATFPMIELPMPQISITLGQEDTDRYMGDQTGISEPVLDTDGATIAWDIIKGFYSKANWTISIVTTTKDEAIWLTRLCQHTIFESMLDFEAAGITEVTISTADMRLEQDQQPLTIFNRTIRLTATVINSWKKRVPATTYKTGNNTALI